MRVKLQLVMCHDEGHEETVTEVITLNKNHQRIEHLGVTLAESKRLLSTRQRHLLQQQVATFLDARSTCPGCGTPLTLKAHGSRSLRTLFGKPSWERNDRAVSKVTLATGNDGRRLRVASPWALMGAISALGWTRSITWLDKKHHFEVIAGKSILSFQEDEEDRRPSLKRFGLVHTYDDAKTKRRLHEVLHSQGLQMNQKMTFLADGDDKLRVRQMEMSPKATHILDGFHLTMKLMVLGQYGKGLLQCEAVLGEPIQDQIERLTWSLWHGQVDKALGKIDELETSIAPFNETYARFPRLVKALAELRTYIVNNRYVIPNDGERYRNGEPIATGFVESTVNEVVSKRFGKKQQMQWSKEEAHLLLQTRVRTLNGELSAILKRWYPDMDLEAQEMPLAV